MRKWQKQEAEELLKEVFKIHEEIKKNLVRGRYEEAKERLAQCQEKAIELGNLIEASEGEGVVTVSYLEEYCEIVFSIHGEISERTEYHSGQAVRRLNKAWSKAASSMQNDISIKKEAVFLPYKASMWDSLESIWRAADEDPGCDAFVIPIPYFDKNPDGSLKEMHYEGDQYPEDVPVTKYDVFDFGAHRPDMIFIHNPYDNLNHVTSVHPFFYSENMKKFTDCLVYVPYYAMMSGTGSGRALCSAYIHADYIVIQSVKYRKFFDARIADKKFLPLGSPKFDKIIRKCQNPPNPPEDWRKKMEGKRTYLYNTSINDMLDNTERFLKKMEYVFHCFRGRDDVCLVWRPHPLMDSTFDSMREQYRPVYRWLKQKFIQEGWGIYDNTPDIEDTVALCDAYIGGIGTSVISIIGMAGKPIFLLNNGIHHRPLEDDWRGEVVKRFRTYGCDKWVIAQGNKLYYSPDSNYQYEYYCNLSEYASGGYYWGAIELGGKVYICPANAQNVLIVQDKKIVKKVELEHCLERSGAFCDARSIGSYIFLIPDQYPAVVRLDTRNDEVSYITGINEVFIKNINGVRKIGGSGVWKQYLLIASPSDNKVAAIDSDSMQVQLLSTNAENECGCSRMVVTGTDMWLLPYSGKTVMRWNPDTGDGREYSGIPETFRCRNMPYGLGNEELPYSWAADYKENLVLSPARGNMFLLLNKETGECKEWKLPFEISYEEKSGYFPMEAAGCFVRRTDTLGEWTYRYFHEQDRRLYDINLETKEYREIPITFQMDELKKHEMGFDIVSERMGYCCFESAFNSLEDFLNDEITGRPFSKEKQMQSYRAFTVNGDGTCGEKIYQFISGLDSQAGRQ